MEQQDCYKGILIRKLQGLNPQNAQTHPVNCFQFNALHALMKCTNDERTQESTPWKKFSNVIPSLEIGQRPFQVNTRNRSKARQGSTPKEFRDRPLTNTITWIKELQPVALHPWDYLFYFNSTDYKVQDDVLQTTARPMNYQICATAADSVFVSQRAVQKQTMTMSCLLEVAFSVQWSGKGGVIKGTRNCIPTSVGHHAPNTVFRLLRRQLLTQDVRSDVRLWRTKQSHYSNVCMASPVQPGPSVLSTGSIGAQRHLISANWSVKKVNYTVLKI